MHLKTSFLSITSILGYLCSIYSLLNLYLLSNFLWVFSGLGLLLTGFCLCFGTPTVTIFFRENRLLLSYKKFIYVYAGLNYFFSSVNGFTLLLWQSPIHDKSVIVLPIIISIFIFGGASLSLFVDSDYSKQFRDNDKHLRS